MVNAFGMLFAMLLVASIVVFLDWWSSRKEQHSRNRAA